MFSSIPLSVLSAVFPIALAQSSGSGSGSDSGPYVTGLVDHLNGLGYTEAANVLTKANSTTSGQQWLSELPNGNYTAFVPDNAAFQNLSTEVSGNDELLSQYLSYHFVHGNFLNSTANSTSGGGGGGGGGSGMTSESPTSSPAPQTLLAWYRRQDNGDGSSGGQSMAPPLMSGVYPNDTIARTLLNSSNLVMLEGNKSQVLAWTKLSETGNVTLLNQANINVTNSSSYQNLFINGIDGVIQPPGNLSQSLSAVNATSFLALAQQANVTGPNGENVTVLDALSSLHGFTLFVPNNDAIQNASSTLSGLQNNGTAVMALLGNHVINGTTIYSPDFRNATASGFPANFTSAAGEPIAVAFNGTNLAVQNQNGSDAQIIRPDVLLENGVFHIVNNVLVETNSNSSQASSAVLSASSAAAVSSTDTLPIGGFATFTSSGMSQNTETSSAPTASATQLATNGSPKAVGSSLLMTLLGAIIWIFGL